MNRLPQISVILCVVLLFGVGCGNARSDSVKSRWLAGEPCAPPCWEGIHPGTTTLEESIQLVEAIPGVDSDSIVVGDWMVPHVKWGYQDSKWVGSATVFDDESEDITIIAFDTPNLCLREIIDAYGEPDYLAQMYFRYDGTIYLIWLSQGFIYNTYELWDEPGKPITKSICGGSITQFPIGMPLSELPDSRLSFLTEDDLAPWQGYGEY